MDILIPVLILVVIIALAAVAFRVITQRGGSDQDSTSNFPNQEPRGERPLGDTPEAHDEINPRDIPKDNPARQEAEEQAAGGGSDETQGNREGAQGGGEPSTSRAE
jgi:hypothetical protein